MRTLVMRLERWVFDDESFLYATAKVLLLLSVIAVPFILYDYFATESAYEQCLSSGGAWTVVGVEKRAGYIRSGQVLVPHTYTVRKEGCVRR